MLFVICLTILWSTLSLLTSIDVVPAIPLIILYLQFVILTCVVNTLPAAVCRGVCDVLLLYHWLFRMFLHHNPQLRCLQSFLSLPYSRIYRERRLCLDGHLSSVPLHLMVSG